MVIVAIFVGIILLGLVIGLVSRPKVQARARAHVDAVQATAAAFGWQIDRSPVPDLRARLPLGGMFDADTAIRATAQLTGQWRGVPVVALQLTYGTDGLATRTWHTMTMIMVPRPVPGTVVALSPQGMSWANFLASDRQIGHPPFDQRYHVHAKSDEYARATLTPAVAGLLATDPRMRDRMLFFGEHDLAASFPGPITQQQVLAQTADLLLEVAQRQAAR
ncbi:hypothetical protein L3Q67_09160 [Saccharothrix sp. AJ9571]|nr:hypothetical protein L3Q67_09160 [Saccharothrix sp. AJ9571]